MPDAATEMAEILAHLPHRAELAEAQRLQRAAHARRSPLEDWREDQYDRACREREDAS